MFGVHLVTATIARISQDWAEHFQGFADTARELVATAPVKHMDETGFRIGGKTQWLHIASTIWLTFYRISPKRGSLLAHVTGIVVYDHWKPYYTNSSLRLSCETRYRPCSPLNAHRGSSSPLPSAEAMRVSVVAHVQRSTVDRGRIAVAQHSLAVG
jgi:hypothetical protein